MLEQLFDVSRRFIETNNRTYHRYFLKKHNLSHRCNIITGQRGVGKTTTIIQYLLDNAGGDFLSKNILYVPTDHFAVNRFSIYEIAEAFVKMGGTHICFDEIHKYAEWSMELKSIYDSFPELRIIASGSSALEIKKGSHDLSRRAIVFKMDGLSFREFLALKEGIDIAPVNFDDIVKDHEKIASSITQTLKKHKKVILPLFKEYLHVGFYPYFNQFDDAKLFQLMLEQNMHTVIESDLTAVYKSLTGESVRKIKKLLSAVASLVPYTPDLNALKEICGIADQRTLKTYLKYLEDAGMISQYQKAGREIDALRKPEKLYLNNTSQMYTISFDNSKNIGNIRETFFSQAVSPCHRLTIPQKGDFIIDGKFVVEIGGKNKKPEQLKDVKNSFFAIDDIESGFENRIPLWLFGFLY